MEKRLPLTMNRQGQKMEAEEWPAPSFLPPSFCLSGPGGAAYEGGGMRPIRVAFVRRFDVMFAR
jgi:hypothetical protein